MEVTGDCRERRSGFVTGDWGVGRSPSAEYIVRAQRLGEPGCHGDFWRLLATFLKNLSVRPGRSRGEWHFFGASFWSVLAFVDFCRRLPGFWELHTGHEGF